MALDLIRARCPPPEGAMEEDDGEVELTLGLSVGGSSRKAPMADAAAQGPAAEAKSGEAEFDFGGPVSSPASSPLPLPPFLHVDGDGGGTAIDQARRREIQTLRRREARRKRDEKKQQQQQKRGIRRVTSGGAGFCGVVTPPETCSPEDRLAMEAQVRAKDREARVEAMDSVPHHKLSANRSPNPNADANPDPILNPNPNLVPFTAQSFPVVAMPYSYPHLQYFPTTNGFRIPCMMPCWAPPMSPGADPRAESSVFHPVACRSFQSYPSPADEATTMMGSPVSSNAVESNAGKRAGVDAVERAPSWTASQGSSSSPASSGHHSGSPRGCSSGGGGGGSSTSDERSHTRQSPGHLHPHPQPPLLPQLAGLPQGQSDSSISSRPTEPDPPLEPKSTQTPLPNGITSPAKPVVVPAGGDVMAAPPPRPQLPRMPCVSATGDGPNGRTITGVLYRYTKAEVCIVCACHGSSFSPAEFVRHAGGTDVTHPLRQITVVSS